MNTIEKNRITKVSFSHEHIEATFVENVENYWVEEKTILVNVGTQNIYLDEAPKKAIPPLHSTIVKKAAVKEAEQVLLIRVFDDNNIGNIIFEDGWFLLGDVLPADSGFPKNTPLWRSPQVSLATLKFDPYHMTGQKKEEIAKEPFELKVNLWFASAKTDCAIHNQHDFIEVHTQIYGSGRMQKFRTQDFNTLYEDLLMSPGYTTPIPFCNVEEENQFVYPWHQYYADTDCIWLAVEYHPVKQA